MARVPVIDSPCPIADRPLPPGATNHCTVCDRSVHNLDRMSSRERVEFMSSCSGKVCVAYTVRIPVSTLRKRRLAAAAITAAALVSLPAAADESLVTGMSAIEGDANQLPNCDDGLMEVVTTGDVLRADQAEWVDDGKDAPPDLPSIEDDGK
jgi:hypothetical protein